VILTIDFQTMDELHDKVQVLAGWFRDRSAERNPSPSLATVSELTQRVDKRDYVNQTDAPTTAATVTTTQADAPPAKGRKSKKSQPETQPTAAQEQGVTVPASETVTEVATDAPIVTRDIAAQKLKLVFDTKGVGPASEVLQRLGYKRISEVKDEHLPQLVADCEKALAG
jgi:hypothetical protein